LQVHLVATMVEDRRHYPMGNRQADGMDGRGWVSLFLVNLGCLSGQLKAGGAGLSESMSMGRWKKMARQGLAIASLSLLTSCVGVPGRLVRYPNNDRGGLSSPHDDREAHHSGRYIVLVSDRRGRQEIELFDTRSRNLVAVPGLNRADTAVSHPSVSADGQFIAYAGVRDGRSDIYLYRRGRRESRNLTQRLRTAVRNPSISERGERVAFEVSVNGQWEIAIYDLNGRPLNIRTNPR